MNVLRDHITKHLRSLGYGGNVTTNMTIANGTITIYSPHWVNRLRNNGYVFWACIILQLWLIAWPIIWFLERRYEVVRSVWWSSREVQDPRSPSGWRKAYAMGRDEKQLAEMWAPVVSVAAWSGCTHAATFDETSIPDMRRLAQRPPTQVPWLNRASMLAGSVMGMMGRMGQGQSGGNRWMSIDTGRWGEFSMSMGGR